MHNSQLDSFERVEYEKPDACDKCGERLKYKGLGEYVCEKCGNLMMDDYGKIRNYLEQHPGVNAVVLSEKTGVSKRVIKQMLMDEKFDLVNNKGLME